MLSWTGHFTGQSNFRHHFIDFLPSFCRYMGSSFCDSPVSRSIRERVKHYQSRRRMSYLFSFYAVYGFLMP